MTKIYAAFGLIAAILAMSSAEYRAAENTAAEMHSIIEKAELSAREESKETEKYCREISDVWNAHKPVLQLFLPHAELDQTDIAVNAAAVYAEVNDYDNVRVQLAELHDHVHSLSESEKISIYNLM